MKLFCFDVDNTLVSHFKSESYIPASTKTAIKMIKSAGHECIIVTGRSYNHTKPIMDELGINSAILCNGCVVFENHELVSSIELDQDVVKYVLNEVVKYDLPLLALNEYDMFIYDKNNGTKFEDILAKTINTIKGDLSDSLKNIDFGINYNLISIFHPHVFDPHPSISIIPWGNEGIEIIPVGINKGLGISKYIQRHNILKSDVYVFGDNYNDCSMFDIFYDNSNVLGNAPEEVKTKAKYICNHIDDDGVYKQIKTILG